MELEFIPERLTIIRRLKGLTTEEIDRKMREISGGKNSMNIDRWEKIPSKHHMQKVEFLALATEMPVGFYFYKNVQINMVNLKVEITIMDTMEKIEFDFLQRDVM